MSDFSVTQWIAVIIIGVFVVELVLEILDKEGKDSKGGGGIFSKMKGIFSDVKNKVKGKGKDKSSNSSSSSVPARGSGSSSSNNTAQRSRSNVPTKRPGGTGRPGV